MSNTPNILKRKTDSSPVEVENTFSFRLAYAIAMRNTSQAELSIACGMSPSHISQYITKHTVPRIDKVKIMAEKLQGSEMWLMGAGKPTDIDKRDIDDLAPEERELLKIYYALDEEGKMFILQMAQTYMRMKQEQKAKQK